MKLFFEKDRLELFPLRLKRPFKDGVGLFFVGAFSKILEDGFDFRRFKVAGNKLGGLVIGGYDDRGWKGKLSAGQAKRQFIDLIVAVITERLSLPGDGPGFRR